MRIRPSRRWIDSVTPASGGDASARWNDGGVGYELTRRGGVVELVVSGPPVDPVVARVAVDSVGVGASGHVLDATERLVEDLLVRQELAGDAAAQLHHEREPAGVLAAGARRAEVDEQPAIRANERKEEEEDPILVGVASLANQIATTRVAFGAPATTKRTLVVVFLRGGMDGLSVIVPRGTTVLAVATSEEPLTRFPALFTTCTRAK